jgi:hypothetical protein
LLSCRAPHPLRCRALLGGTANRRWRVALDGCARCVASPVRGRLPPAAWWAKSWPSCRAFRGRIQECLACRPALRFTNLNLSPGLQARHSSIRPRNARHEGQLRGSHAAGGARPLTPLDARVLASCSTTARRAPAPWSSAASSGQRHGLEVVCHRARGGVCFLRRCRAAAALSGAARGEVTEPGTPCGTAAWRTRCAPSVCRRGACTTLQHGRDASSHACLLLNVRRRAGGARRLLGHLRPQLLLHVHLHTPGRRARLPCMPRGAVAAGTAPRLCSRLLTLHCVRVRRQPLTPDKLVPNALVNKVRSATTERGTHFRADALPLSCPPAAAPRRRGAAAPLCAG